MSSLACKWNWHSTGHQVWYDKSTFETIRATYPLYFYEDFNGVAGGSVFDNTMIWDVVDVNNATEAIVADSSGGLFRLLMSNAVEDQDAVLFQNDNRTFDIGNGLIFETKIDVSTLPVGVTGQAVFGMCGDHALDKDALLESTWFKLDGSAAVLCETDDTVTNTDDIAAGVTVVAGTPNIYRIDFTTLADVKFFIDGVRVASGQTFDMSGASAAEQLMQPYFSLDKTGDNSEIVLDIDYVKIWSNRS